jgi:hypothetical protein
MLGLSNAKSDDKEEERQEQQQDFFLNRDMKHRSMFDFIHSNDSYIH